MHEITVKAHVVVPRVPNFVKLVGAGEDTKLDIADIPDGSLRALGAAWTDALLANAIERRASRVAIAEGR